MMLSFFLLLVLPSLVTASCSGEQSYVLTIKTSFTPNVNPGIPQENTFIPLIIAVAHTSAYELYRRNKHVDDAVAEVVAKHHHEKLVDSLRRHLDSGNISSYDIIDDAPVSGISQLELKVRDNSHLISIIAPLSPSPAWFIGTSGRSVCENGAFVIKVPEFRMEILNAGLDDGDSFQPGLDPFDVGNSKPVEPVAFLRSTKIGVVEFEQGTLGVNWWKILLGVLVAILVLVVLVGFLYPRWKRRSREVPLTSEEGVDW